MQKGRNETPRQFLTDSPIGSAGRASGYVGGDVINDAERAERWRSRVHWWTAVVAGTVFAWGWQAATGSWWQGTLYGLVWYAVVSVAGNVRTGKQETDDLRTAARQLQDRIYGLEVMLSRVERREDSLVKLAEQQMQLCTDLVRRVGDLERDAALLAVPEVPRG